MPKSEGGLRAWFQRPYPVLGILFGIYMCHAMDRHVVALLAEPIRADLRLSDTQLGLLTGLAFALFYTVFGVPVGWLADRVGRVLTIAVACVTWSLFSMLGAFSANFIQLAGTRTGVAIGESGGTAPAYSLIADKFAPDRRGQAYGIYHVGSSFGTFIGAALAGWVAARYGWRAALVAVSLPGLLFAAALFLLVREPARRGSDGAAPAPHADDADAASLADEAPVVPQRAPPIWTSFRDFLSHPVLRLCFIFAGLTACLTHSLIAWLPAFLMRVKGMTLIQISEYYSITFSVFFGFGMWFGGFLAGRLATNSPKAFAYVPGIGLLVAIPFIFAAIYAPTWQLSLILWMPAVLSAGTFLAPAVALVQAYAPRVQATVFGSIYLLANNLVGNGLGPLYVGAISDAFKPAHGDQALSFGLLALIPVLLLAAAGQFLMVRAIGRTPPDMRPASQV
jgi:MFS family permease